MCLGRRAYGRLPAPQEGIDAPLAAQRGRQRDGVAAAQFAHRIERLEDVGIAGLDGRCEAGLERQYALRDTALRGPAPPGGL